MQFAGIPTIPSPISNASRQLKARFGQVAEEFPHQQNIGFLELVIVAELELIRLGHDQSLVGLAKNAFLLQSSGTSPDSFDRQPQKPGERSAGKRDMGLAVALEWAFSPELRSGKVVAILEDWALPPDNLSAVNPMGRLASTKARAFVSFVERFMTRPDSVSPQREAYRGGDADAKRIGSRMSGGPR